MGCSAPTLHEWVKRSEVDRGVRAGVPTEVAEKMKGYARATANQGNSPFR
jgi:transposase